MERKIGEIKQVNGEWCQCIEGKCIDCYFSKARYLCKQFITKKFCTSGIIFKKLEKVGVPYHNSEKKLCQQYKCYINPLVTDEIVYVFADNRAVIEIKQTKEDMEEKKLNLKPFDIQKAREGNPVCTRDGRKARIICFDRKDNTPIVALIERVDGTESLQCVHNDGKCFHYDTSNNDLMMLPEKKVGWINVYKGGKLDSDYIYPTKADAVENIFQPMKARYIDTIKVTWEEQP